MKIQVAIARKILVALWHMLSKKEDFIDVYLKRLEELKKRKDKSDNLNRVWPISRLTYFPVQCNYLCGAWQPGLQICRYTGKGWTPA